MSGRLVGQAMLDPLDPSLSERRRRGLRAVLLVLAEAANGDGIAWPSRATIAERACISDRQVRRLLGDLEDLGRITSERGRRGGRGRSTRYRVTPRADDGSAHARELSDGPSGPRKGGHERPPLGLVKGDMDDRKGGQERPERGTCVSPEPKEPSVTGADGAATGAATAVPWIPGTGRGETGMATLTGRSRAAGTEPAGRIPAHLREIIARRAAAS